MLCVWKEEQYFCRHVDFISKPEYVLPSHRVNLCSIQYLFILVIGAERSWPCVSSCWMFNRLRKKHLSVEMHSHNMNLFKGVRPL